MIIDEQFQKKFIEEASDLVNDLEKALLVLSNNFKDKAIIEQIFRVMHSLKGGSSMFGFTKIDTYTHKLESIYDHVRNERLEITDELLDITLASVDHIRKLLAEGNNLSPKTLQENEELTKKITKIAEIPGVVIQEQKAQIVEIKEPEKVVSSQTEGSLYYIFLRPNEDIFADGTNLLYLLDELHSLGPCIIAPHIKKIPDLETIEVSKCYSSWDIFLVTPSQVDAIIDVFIFIDDKCDIEINKISDKNLLNNAKFVERINQIIEKEGDFDVKELHELAENIDVAIHSDIIDNQQKQVTATNAEAAMVSKINAISSIRVSSDKLDDLINLVSELVTTQARLSLYAEKSAQNELLAISENVEKISRRLRDNAFSIRLIPIENMLARFHRLVRELSQECQKEIGFETKGADTELDKTIIENLSDPLMHIIRNSIDHGIEYPEERVKAGKPKQGKILLKAYYSGTNVHIQIQDDGAGIDLVKIRDKAISKEIISADAVMSDREILNLIFLPGFSTAKKVTNVSGRGVGMDVVKRKISDIRGEIDIDTQVGVGTTITIKLPLTLSIIDGLLVTIGETHFVIPLASVDKCYEFKHVHLKSAINNLILADEDRISFLYLRDLFEIKEDTPDIEQIVVVEYNDIKIGLAVDKVIGEYQAVLKSLGKMYKDQDFISGSTILGDGTVALVMDTNKIINQYSKQVLKNIGG